MLTNALMMLFDLVPSLLDMTYDQKQPFPDVPSRSQMFFGVLKNCANFTGKHLYWSLL